MQLTALLAYVRAIQLKRDLVKIERQISNLSPHQMERLALAMLREYEAAGQCPLPHLYQSPDEDARYRPWGEGTRIGRQRLSSGNPELRLRGMALWLAVASHETRDSTFASTQAVHRRLIGISRRLRMLAAENAARDATAPARLHVA